MNANELAGQLESYPMFNFKPHATMLRQQQAEIEFLLDFIKGIGEGGRLNIWREQNK